MSGLTPLEVVRPKGRFQNSRNRVGDKRATHSFSSSSPITGTGGPILVANQSEIGWPKSVVTSMAGFAGARRPQPAGGLPSSLDERFISRALIYAVPPAESECFPMGRTSQSAGSGRVNEEVVDPARGRDFVSRPVRWSLLV